jgi:hypothetical protein
MGLSIYYSGRIRIPGLIPQLTSEVMDICRSLKWEFHLFDDEHVKGICFAPAKCEPLFVTFSKTGELCSPILLQYEIHPATTIPVKTQYAGIDAHKAVIKLLKHLRPKYFSEFELEDEGGYWQRNDENILQQQFAKYEYLLNAVCTALQDFETKEGETSESLIDRLERFLQERWSKK